MQNTISAFGAFLDPVADKLMVATVLILLASEPLKGGPWAGNTWLLPSLSSGTLSLHRKTAPHQLQVSDGCIPSCHWANDLHK